MPETLATYLTKTRRLLHDASGQYWPEPDLIADINAGIAQRDLWSGGSRSLQANVALTIGQDQYDLTALFPTLTVLDVINIWLIFGSTRYLLANPPFTDLTTFRRPFTAFQTRPTAWARFGATTVYIATAPAAAYTTDWDLSVLSKTLVNAGDADPLPFPYTEPVPYYAAYQAKLNARQYADADTFFGFFQKAIRDIEGARVGEMVSGYTGRR